MKLFFTRFRFEPRSRGVGIFLLVLLSAVIFPLGFAAGDSYSLRIIPVVVDWDEASNAPLLLRHNGETAAVLTGEGIGTVFVAEVSKLRPVQVITLSGDYAENYTVAAIGGEADGIVTIEPSGDLTLPLFIMPAESDDKVCVLYSPNGGTAESRTLPRGFDYGDLERTITLASGEIRLYKANDNASMLDHGFMVIGAESAEEEANRVLLQSALRQAAEFIGGSYTPQSLSTLNFAIVNGNGVYENLAADQTEIDEAVTQLLNALMGLEYPPVPAPLPLTGEAVTLLLAEEGGVSGLTEGTTVFADIKVLGASGLSNLLFDVNYDSAVLEFDYAGGNTANGFKVISADKSAGMVSIALMNVNGFSQLEGEELAEPVARIRFRAAGEGRGSVKLVRAAASSVRFDGTTLDNPVVIGSGEITLNVLSGAVQELDFNGDGVITLADLTEGMPYYRVSNEDFNWESAKRMDYDGDGIITVADYALIVNEMKYADWGVFDN
ncbi:MAG: hypothetical protein LBN97_09300 [Oscillospiraceae bacterium]|nr:hypothetical protein [Oscillospiraceae bacterium]